MLERIIRDVLEATHPAPTIDLSNKAKKEMLVLSEAMSSAFYRYDTGLGDLEEPARGIPKRNRQSR